MDSALSVLSLASTALTTYQTVIDLVGAII